MIRARTSGPLAESTLLANNAELGSRDHDNCGRGELTSAGGGTSKCDSRPYNDGAALFQPCRAQDAPMANTFFHLTTLAALLVLGVLFAGLWNMTREGTASLSQKLMRWRVGLQFVAIVIIMLAVYFKRTVS